MKFFQIQSLSILSDLIEALKNDFFTINYGDYENIDIGRGGIVTVPLVVVGIAIGIAIAAFSVLFTKHALGDFIKSITYEGCRTPETAKSLADLGYSRNFTVRSALRSNHAFKKYVRYTDGKGNLDRPWTPEAPKEETEQPSSIFHGEVPKTEKKPEESAPPAEPKEYGIIEQTKHVDIDNMKFFISASDCDVALKRFVKKRVNPFAVVAVIVLTLLIIILTFKALPGLLQLLDNFIGIIKPKPNYI